VTTECSLAELAAERNIIPGPLACPLTLVSTNAFRLTSSGYYARQWTRMAGGSVCVEYVEDRFLGHFIPPERWIVPLPLGSDIVTTVYKERQRMMQVQSPKTPKTPVIAGM